ncbi:unnamed protein product [Tuber aestivum]|uniref:SRCR domain-containing protein n=1 Tax=Tuber aestivum TaxID=59557 RepID=A0A292Q411_9PEZI|nr:unnamed protein product [Tuber aestivum]
MLFNSITSFLVLSATLVAAIPAPITERASGCASGLRFTGQAGCSRCKTEGNVVCGRDEDRTTDLKCKRFSTGLTWVPIDNPGACGVDSPHLKTRQESTSSCPSGKPFTGQAGCSTCATEGNIVCGRDEGDIADLKCTRFSTGLVWVPVKNPGKCGVDAPNRPANPRATPTTCPSGKQFTFQAGCSKCATVGNEVCGRDEDRVTDLRCTRIGNSNVWVPIDNQGACGVSSAPASNNRPTCASGKPFTAQAGCSSCSTLNNIVCGRDEDRVTDLKCSRFGSGLTWIPVDNPKKCGV